MILLMIAPEDAFQRLLDLDVAGRPFIEHLPAQLRAMKGVDELRVIQVGTGCEPGSTVGDSGITDTDVFAVKRDVWFTGAALAELLAAAAMELRPLKLFLPSGVHPAGTPNRELLAVYVPKAKAGKVFREVEDLGQLRTLDELAARIMDARELQAPELDPERPPIRVRSLLDVSVVETDILYERAVEALASGVRIRDPRAIAIRGELRCGEGVEIDLHVIIEGTVTLGDGVRVGANCMLKAASVGAGTKINPYSIVENAEVGSKCFIGPYARVRPGSLVGDEVSIGNFVEVKNSEIGSGSRINHLAFVGDASLGKNVTIGAATITCNHDRRGVARTEIGEGAYIGSGCLLVAPLSIGAHATIGAGSTITKEVPEGKLTIARSRQVTIENWKPPVAEEQ